MSASLVLAFNLSLLLTHYAAKRVGMGLDYEYSFEFIIFVAGGKTVVKPDEFL